MMMANSSPTATNAPLEGLRILDFTSGVGGAYCTMMLADLGADVLKVEPLGGSPDRADDVVFTAYNRNKNAIALDFEGADFAAQLRGLLADADAVVECFAPAVAVRYGLDAKALRAIRPDLIHVALTPFGRESSAAERDADNLILQALSGSMEVTGEPDRAPVLMGLQIPEQMGGIYAGMALLAALERRDNLAVGASVDISMLDVSIGLLSYMANIHFADGSMPRRLGSSHPVIYPYNAFECADGFLTAAPFTQDFWRKFAAAIGRADLADNERYRTFKDRLRNRDELSAILNPILKSRPRAHWLDVLDVGDVPNGPVNTVPEALAMPHTASRSMIVDLEGDPHGRRALGCPIKVEYEDGSTFRPRYRTPPALGSADLISAAAAGSEPAGANVAEEAALPLAGLKVLDLTRMFAGPYCAMLLADMGADVIKVEEGRIGDPTRRNLPIVNGESAYFMSVNRGKKSVVMDLKDPVAQVKLRALIADVDVVIENFRPGVMAKLGLDYASLKQINPDVILCSISGFGQTGPMQKKISFDLVNQAMAGTMAMTGYQGGEPVRIGIPIGDLSGGIYGALGVLAALRSRRRTGRGAMVDVALHDVLLAQLGDVAQRYLATGEAPQPLGSWHVDQAPHGAYEASDGYLAISVKSDAQWRALANATGQPDLADDPQFLTSADRVAARDAIDARLAEVLRQRPVAEWTAIFDQVGVLSAKICSIAEALRLPIAVERGAVFGFSHATAGDFRTVGTALFVDGAPWRASATPPVHGQDDAWLHEHLAAENRSAGEVLAGSMTL